MIVDDLWQYGVSDCFRDTSDVRTCFALPRSYIIFTTALVPLFPARRESSLRPFVINVDAPEAFQ